MYKFVKIKTSYLSEKLPNIYWALWVASMQSLRDYLRVQSPLFVRAYFDLKSNLCLGNHPVGKYQEALNSLFIGEELSDRVQAKQKSFLYDLEFILDKYIRPKSEALKRGKVLLINSTGVGFCYYNPTFHNILDVKLSDKIEFPDEGNLIKVSRWEGGSHWYVRIGQYDLPEKYTTYKAALKAGQNYSESQIKNKGVVKR